MTKKKVSYFRKTPIIIPTRHFNQKLKEISYPDFLKIKSCLNDISLPSKKTQRPSFKTKNCGKNIQLVYKLSGAYVYPLTFIKRKGKM